jgi:hypothetical protein
MQLGSFELCWIRWTHWLVITIWSLTKLLWWCSTLIGLCALIGSSDFGSVFYGSFWIIKGIISGSGHSEMNYFVKEKCSVDFLTRKCWYVLFVKCSMTLVWLVALHTTRHTKPSSCHGWYEKTAMPSSSTELGLMLAPGTFTNVFSPYFLALSKECNSKLFFKAVKHKSFVFLKNN